MQCDHLEIRKQEMNALNVNILGVHDIRQAKDVYFISDKHGIV